MRIEVLIHETEPEARERIVRMLESGNAEFDGDPATAKRAVVTIEAGELEDFKSGISPIGNVQWQQLADEV